MKKLIAVALLSSTFATQAQAESPVYAGVMAGDQYFGVLGAYQIDKMFSIEGHYAKVLHPTVNTPTGSIKADTSMIGVDVVAMLPWKVKQVPELTFFAKGGMDYVKNKVTTTVGGISGEVTTNETKLTLGAGAEYEVNKNFSARAGFGVMGYRNDLYIAGIFRF